MRFCPVLKLGHLIEMRIQDVESLLAEVEQILSVISYSPSYNSLIAPEAGQDASNYPLGRSSKHEQIASKTPINILRTHSQ